MEITRFEIVDLGTGWEDTVSPGVSFRPEFDSDVIGAGPTAKAAFDDATSQLALDGFGTRMLHESGIEAGYYSQAAEAKAEDIHDDDLEPEDLKDTPILYHVLIRFKDPNPDPSEE